MSEGETTIAQRLSDIVRVYENGTKAGFARAIGMTPQGVGDLLSGKKGGPSFSVLQNILMAYPGVREEWLIFGHEPMYKNSFLIREKELSVVREEEPAPYAGAGPRVLTVQVGPDNEENIELVSVRAAAGYAAGGFLQEEFIEQLPSFRLPDPAYRNGSFRAFQVSGESMQSTLYNGDWVICRYVERWGRDIRDTFVHVVVTEETVLVKRVSNRLNERGELTLHSDNPAYPVQFIDGAQVREVWVAVAKLSRQFVNPRYDVNAELARHAATLEELLSRVEGLEKKRFTN